MPMSDQQSAQHCAAIERPAKDAKRYANRRYLLFAGHLATGAAFLLFMIAGGSTLLGAWAKNTAGPGRFIAGVFFYFAGFSLAYLAVTLPLEFYGEYVLEHQFGLSTQTLGRWARRRAKKWLYSFAIVLPLVLAFYWMLRRWPHGWWLPASAAWIFVGYVLTRFAPRILIPLFYKLEPVKDEALAARLDELAAKAGISLAGTYRIDLSRETKKANAAVVGLGSTRRVVLGDTLLEKFTPVETAAVFAHELGHIVHGDLLKGFLLGGALLTASLYAGSLILARAAGSVGVAVHDVETLPVLLAVLAAIQLFVMPFEKWYSRWRELRSDEYAVRATGDREAFISAMQKLGAMNLADVNPNKVAEILLWSHPPISKRVRFAMQLDLGQDK